MIAQDMADIPGLPVDHPADVETMAKGAAMLAAVDIGLFPSLSGAFAATGADGTRFEPAPPDALRAKRLLGWQAALDAG